MQFEAFGLDLRIMANIDAMNFRSATDIQYKAIPPIMSGNDILAIAQTGTGKTAAFAIPSVHNLLTRPRRKGYGGVRCLVMEPTHELARQTADVFEKIALDTGLRIISIHGGVEQEPQVDALRKGVDVLVATPGRMFDLMHQGELDTSGVEILILDEADHMLDNGFINDIQQTVRRIPRRRQSLFFSATIDAKIKSLAYSLVYKPLHIRISPKNMVAKNVTHALLRVGMDEKRFFLERIFNENVGSRFIVFVRTRVRAERVVAAMERVGIDAVCLHRDKSPKQRAEALDALRTEKVRMLVTTDIAARGIDIPAVDYVVNYDLPTEAENYVHRVGRTGRGVNRGYALSLCAKEEEGLLCEIEEYIGGAIKLVEMDKEDRAATVDLSAASKTDWLGMTRDLIDGD